MVTDRPGDKTDAAVGQGQDISGGEGGHGRKDSAKVSAVGQATQRNEG